MPALPAVPVGGTVTVSGELKTSVFDDALAHDRRIIVMSSPGGTGASALALSRVKSVVIDGPCLSACAWAFVLSEHACFTRRAAFGFHASHDPGTGRRMLKVTRYWLALARPSLRPEIANIETSSKVIPVGLAMMRKHYGDRECHGVGRLGSRRTGMALSGDGKRPAMMAPYRDGMRITDKGGDTMLEGVLVGDTDNLAGPVIMQEDDERNPVHLHAWNWIVEVQDGAGVVR